MCALLPQAKLSYALKTEPMDGTKMKCGISKDEAEALLDSLPGDL
jgi:hypothetical protein